MGMSGYVMDYESQPLTAECRRCDGSGEVVFNKSFSQDPIHDERLDCIDCNGTGEITCDKGGVGCRFDPVCYCEAAWECQQEERASGE